MNTIRPCGCKGIRTCLQCEKDYEIQKVPLKEQLHQLDAWSYCPKCERIYAGWDATPATIDERHEMHKDTETGLPLPGVYVEEQFLSAAEGARLIADLDELPWAISQSGRRKQNFGPKTNFKKMKLRNGDFHGFPASTEYVQRRFDKVHLLQHFQTIEQCSLEYDPTKGACIDPHIDDCWIWGERVVTVNCLGDAVLTLTAYDAQNAKKYNLDLVACYEKRLISPLLSDSELKSFQGKVIRIPMPNLSLIILYGAARYQFEHNVLREDVNERRVCIAYREFTPMYIDGESKESADIVRKNAQHFW